MKYLPLVSLIVMISGTAYAADAPATNSGFFFKPYVGADYQYSSVDYKDIFGTSYSYSDLFATSFNGGDVHLGARIHKHLGFEVGYFGTANSTKSDVLGTSVSSSAKFDGWTFDAMGYLPLGESNKFELIGTVGVARTTADGSVTVSGTTYSAIGSETEGRLGGGAQYWLTDNLNVRALVRYQNADFDGLAKDVVAASLGVNWQF